MGTLTSAAILLAVDGGNSKTDVMLLRADGQVLRRERAGAFSPQLIGAQAAVASLAPAIASVMEAAGNARPVLLAGHLANADLPEEEATIADAIRAHDWADHVIVENDTLAMLRTGTDATSGVAVVCGAGINAVGIAPDRPTVRYPALGRLSGDWGGGFGIGKEALWHATRAEDGRGPSTALPLAGQIATHFGLASATEVASAMHLGVIGFERMHEIVPLLFEIAAAGDPIASAIVHRQAEEISLLAVTTMRRLDLLDTDVTVVLGGGMLTSGAGILVEPVVGAIRAAAPSANIEFVDSDPVLGSALLGLDHLDTLTGHRGDSGARREMLKRTLTNCTISRQGD